MFFARGTALILVILCLPIAAQESTSKAKPSTHRATAPISKSSAPDPGTLRDGIYHNPTFGFSYKLPLTWVDRTADMKQDSPPTAGSQLLLAAFSRPPEAAGESINAAVIIAAESVSNYPGLKNAAEYFEPLTTATTGKGFKVVNEPYEFSVGGRMLVRSDFSREEGPQKMYQSSLAILQKGYIVSFTVVAGSEDDADALLKNLTFAGAQPSPHRK